MTHGHMPILPDLSSEGEAAAAKSLACAGEADGRRGFSGGPEDALTRWVKGPRRVTYQGPRGLSLPMGAVFLFWAWTSGVAEKSRLLLSNVTRKGSLDLGKSQQARTPRLLVALPGCSTPCRAAWLLTGGAAGPSVQGWRTPHSAGKSSLVPRGPV